MIQIDENEEKIIKELVKDPRVSDNQIAKKTKIPVMTVNRKRKKLEEKGLVRYFATVNTDEDGAGGFLAKELYIIKFKIGLTQRIFLNRIEKSNRVKGFFAQHIEYSFLGEKDGHLTLAVVVAARTESELMELFNGKIIQFFKEHFGEEAIKEVIAVNISKAIRLHHNYLPSINMEGGKIKKEWNDEWIFAGKVASEEQKQISQFKK
ncbi:winged helix-turn-helix domain-containing protein [Candidatus Woesearchaeota archaeon]|nr:winged helix-turn-helix domain-containing protein [Candidatus Woesearchaeota archaeon]